MVRRWTDEPHGREGQEISWQNPAALNVAPMLPANEPVLAALLLPSVYAITNLAETGEAEFLAQLERAGVAYRLSPPGARIVGGKLEATSEFPGQTIEYRVGGGAWTRYAAPVAVTGPVEVRTRSFDGRRASRTLEVSAN